MRVRDEDGIYATLDRLLRESTSPLTCVDLHDAPDVRQWSASVADTSDYLGHMYRRGLLGRVVAPKSPGSQARYAYFPKDRVAPPRPPMPTSADEAQFAPLAHPVSTPAAAPAVEPVEPTSPPAPPARPAAPAPRRTVAPGATPLLVKPNIEITDDGGTVVIDLPQLTITIRAK